MGGRAARPWRAGEARDVTGSCVLEAPSGDAHCAWIKAVHTMSFASCNNYFARRVALCVEQTAPEIETYELTKC